MKKRISSRDWEALSAYVDGQLGNRERARLERRLQKDDRLQAALEELRSMRLMLRSLPAVRAPRNFTLTADMVPQRRSTAGAYPALRLASVMATVLFALVFLGDILLTGRPGSAPQMAAFSEQTPVAVLEAPAVPYPQVEAVGEAPAEEPPAEAESMMMVEETAEAGIMAAQPDMSDQQMPLATPTAPAALAVVEEDPETDIAGSESREGEGITSGEKRLPYPVEEPSASEDTLGTASARESRSSVLVLEVVLAVIAVSTGLAALYLRSKTAG